MAEVVPVELLMPPSSKGGLAPQPAAQPERQPLALQGHLPVVPVDARGPVKFPQIVVFAEEDQVPPQCKEGKEVGLTKVGVAGVGTTDEFRDIPGWAKGTVAGKTVWYDKIPIRRVWSVCVVGRKGRAPPPHKVVTFPAWGLVRTPQG